MDRMLRFTARDDVHESVGPEVAVHVTDIEEIYPGGLINKWDDNSLLNAYIILKSGRCLCVNDKYEDVLARVAAAKEQEKI